MNVRQTSSILSLILSSYQPQTLFHINLSRRSQKHLRLRQPRLGLDHLDGYEKAWLNCVIVPSETTSIQPLLEHLPPDSPSSSFCVSIADSPLQALILGDIVSVNVKKGTVVYQLPVDDAAILLHPSCCIVDLKIYIPYVEARQLENRAPPHP
ncbi:hypothetical protein BLNAU_2201 [Blattamonas nauphoetae]|uniref:Uncharacterized protein n=1 Tax=Blattamonas nauphoetae TaxID=2049346 RepID=A0ABQ9YGE7_9EUKA|nr:hypothetical protein BLNAU_2201 [Blattamonas nauphoetae]